MIITSGKQALEHVRDFNTLNWIWLGGDPNKLPLIACGTGGFNEMKETYAETLHDDNFQNLYGVIRFDFDFATAAYSKFVFIRASAEKTASSSPGIQRRMTAVKRGQKQALNGAMEKKCGQFVHLALSQQVITLDDMDLEDFLEKLQRTAIHMSDKMTLQCYTTAVCEFKEMNDIHRTTSKRNSKAKQFKRTATSKGREDRAAEQMRSKSFGNLLDQCQVAVEVATTSEVNVAKVKSSESAENPHQAPAISNAIVYRRGDPILAYLSSSGTWMDDGIVMDILEEQSEIEGELLPAGSYKIRYNGGRNYRYVIPSHAEFFMKPSQRPRPPSTLSGDLYKEVYENVYKKQIRFCNLAEGYLQWWQNAAEARAGTKRHGQICLLDVQVKTEETMMWITTPASKGIIYGFDATVPEVLDAWAQGFEDHAAYADEMQQWMAQQEKNKLGNA